MPTPVGEAGPKDPSPHSLSRTGSPPFPRDAPQPDESTLRMVRQPETRPISTDQLVAEVKGVYASLLMVEAKCCEVDAFQLHNDTRSLSDKQWYETVVLARPFFFFRLFYCPTKLFCSRLLLPFAY